MSELITKIMFTLFCLAMVPVMISGAISVFTYSKTAMQALYTSMKVLMVVLIFSFILLAIQILNGMWR